MKEVKDGLAPAAIRKLTLSDWKAEARELFGPDENKWKFRCSSCGNVQSMEDFAGLHVPAVQVAGNCIGRFVEGKGCKHRIGLTAAAFGLYEVEILCPDGDKLPAFDFARARSEVQP